MKNLLCSVSLVLLTLAPGLFKPVMAQGSSVYVPMSQTEPCWSQFSPSFFLWTCAGSSLPPEGQPYALAIGVIVGEVTVVTIDSGASAMVGQQLAADVRRRFPGRKLFVINTQPKPEHFFGNSGVKKFMLSGVEDVKSFNGRVVAGKKTADLIKARCPACVEQFARRMGSQTVMDTDLMEPDFILSRRQGSFRILNPELSDWQFELLDD
ncbi:MAG: hypothetical protein R3194_12840, partial [Limnobacter sp.]|nr:hypothetical protein [Limnobacter sp.]